jgi:hypothetical protein
MALIGFDISEIKDVKCADTAIEELENEVITVSEVRRRRAQKVRKVEAVCRMMLKKCELKGWKDQTTKLTKMLAKVEDIKADVGDVVNGFNW